jgi:hypothetical protein
MFLIISSVFFLFKPLITQPKLATLEKTAFISTSPATGSGLNLALILKPLYVTVIDANVIRPLSNCNSYWVARGQQKGSQDIR